MRSHSAIFVLHFVLHFCETKRSQFCIRVRQAFCEASSVCGCPEPTQSLLRGADNLFSARIPQVQDAGGSNGLVGQGRDLIRSILRQAGLEVDHKFYRHSTSAQTANSGLFLSSNLPKRASTSVLAVVLYYLPILEEYSWRS